MKDNKLLFPLNLQLFADDGGDNGGNGGQPKTYTQEEFDKLVAERDKFKKANDDLSKENANYKRQAKDKLSEEEKLAEERKEKDKILEETRKELLTIKMTKEFMNTGFDEKTISSIIESFNSGDSVKFAKDLSTHIKALIDNVRKEEQTKFQQSSTTPPANGGQSSGLDPMVERYISSKNSNSNSAREMLFGKK